MGIETEVKFRVPRRNIAALAHLKIPGSRMGERSESNLTSTYFDTRNRKLKRYGLVLRVRQTGGKHIQTIKKVSSGLDRGEWETEVKDGAPDLREADGTPLQKIASKKLRRKLRPVFKTSVHRITLPVRRKASEIELAIDRGEIIVRGHSSRIEEIELELKRGRPGDLFRIARAVEHKLEAELYLRGKAERGYNLVDGEDEQAVFSQPIKLDGRMSAIAGFKAIAHATLRHFSGNIDAVRNLDPEGVHQMRVGLRRLRAAISLFGDVLPRARTARIKAKLKWLTAELAPAREIDVFVNESVRPIADRGVPRRGARALRDKFSAQRNAAFACAGEAVGSARYRRLLIESAEWIETLRPRPDDDRTIPAYAARVLGRRIDKARKRGKRLAELDPGQRHKLRIRIKKIRYAIDFFRSLYRKRDQDELAELSSLTKRIQSALGSLNDFMAHRELATEAALEAPPANRRAQAFASGFIVGQEREAARSLMKDAAKELHRLHRLRITPNN